MQVDFYGIKLQSHLGSKELKSVGVNSFVYSSNSFKLGGLKAMGTNKVVSPVFSNKNFTNFFSNPACFSQTHIAGYPSRTLTLLFQKGF